MHATTTSAGFDRLGPTMLGSAPQAWRGAARQGWARSGSTRHRRHGPARIGTVWLGTAPQAWQGQAWLGEARHGIAGPARPGSARQGQAPQERHGSARRGAAWSGTAGLAWRGLARRGAASQAWRGWAGPGTASQARPGKARHGRARRDIAGKARRGATLPGLAQQDTNREGESGVQMAPNFSPDKNMTNTKQMTAADAIREIAEIHGHVTPQLVVDAAKPKESPLHNNFEWNNTKAAAEFRLIQAAHLIRKIKVTIEASEDQKVSVRQFVNVAPINDDEPTSGLYVTVQDAMEVTSYREQLLNQCRRDIVAFKTKYAALTEAASIIKAMDKLKP